MIEPQVLHGGASSWFFIAANDDLVGLGASASNADGAFTSIFGASVRLKPDTTPSEPDSALSPCPLAPWPPESGSFMFTPALNCASGERNLVAIHRKM